jgi:hypothetical protein
MKFFFLKRYFKVSHPECGLVSYRIKKASTKKNTNFLMECVSAEIWNAQK